MSKVVFDMPHALVTLTTVEGDVEIEVWPKAGQSAYVVIPPAVAREIGTRLLLLADEQDGATDDSEADEPSPAELAADPALPANIVDLSRRRRPN